MNFDTSSGADDAASFERLLRKLLSMPHQPAIIIVNTMELMPPKPGAETRREHLLA